jgi:hypothetical protein
MPKQKYYGSNCGDEISEEDYLLDRLCEFCRDEFELDEFIFLT